MEKELNTGAADPRDEFEAVFPMPKYVERCGESYIVNAFNAWDAMDYLKKWEGWDACHTKKKAAFTPEGYVLVPRELTDEIAEAIALSAGCCGGIAYDTWEAIMGAVAAGGQPPSD